ncbi:MAG: endopeptidase La [Rhodobacteraceae bacterium]|nr:endopeptidase La [Paracoccaceae bacterium]
MTHSAGRHRFDDLQLPEDALILLPVRDVVPFPGMVFPLSVRRASSVTAVEQAVRTDCPLGVVLQRDPSEDAPDASGLHEAGCVATVLRYVTGPESGAHLVCRGTARFRLSQMLRGYPFTAARVAPLPAGSRPVPPTAAEDLRALASELFALLPHVPQVLTEALADVTDPGELSDLVAALADLPAEDKQTLLESLDPMARIESLTRHLRRRVEVLRITHDIDAQARLSLDRHHRDMMLREQLASIRHELGERGDDPSGSELCGLARALADAGLPPEVEARAFSELARHDRMAPDSAEATALRNWLEWLTELPWRLPEDASVDLAEARRVLDADHHGLERIKARILEHLAVRKLAPQGKAPILCFVGPPGVGKTSLGQSIARAMQRPFARLSLGGVSDEAEIRGHRRTYVGAMPGAVIQQLRRAGARNCVLMLDEVDKLGPGGASAALLEVLDPAQNAGFRDAYLGVDFDLSRVVLLATANVLDDIPAPLRDRMEVMPLRGYLEDEKLEIAQRHLLPLQSAATGLAPGQVVVTPDTLSALVRGYTREAGVRELERQIGALLRHVAMRIAAGTASSVRIAHDDLPRILGAPRHENEVALRMGMPGVATALAWSPVGGDILFIEATCTPGAGRLTLTGQLGEVMRESAQAALTLLKARAATLGIDASVFERSDRHIHVPAGARPKDGASAGAAIFAALASLLLDRPLRGDTALSGEISLRGLVLPVDGLREKVVAAAAAGITRVLLPARNRRDLDELPERARRQLGFGWLETVDDVLAQALETNPADSAA